MHLISPHINYLLSSYVSVFSKLTIVSHNHNISKSKASEHL
jgi:hypothetical protein